MIGGGGGGGFFFKVIKCNDHFLHIHLSFSICTCVGFVNTISLVRTLALGSSNFYGKEAQAQFSSTTLPLVHEETLFE